jgi:hypothetical protein
VLVDAATYSGAIRNAGTDPAKDMPAASHIPGQHIEDAFDRQRLYLAWQLSLGMTGHPAPLDG